MKNLVSDLAMILIRDLLQCFPHLWSSKDCHVVGGLSLAYHPVSSGETILGFCSAPFLKACWSKTTVSVAVLPKENEISLTHFVSCGRRLQKSLNATSRSTQKATSRTNHSTQIDDTWNTDVGTPKVRRTPSGSICNYNTTACSVSIPGSFG